MMTFLWTALVVVGILALAFVGIVLGIFLELRRLSRALAFLIAFLEECEPVELAFRKPVGKALPPLRPLAKTAKEPPN